MITDNQIAAAYEELGKAEAKWTESIIKRDIAEEALIDVEDAELLDLDMANPATQAKANAKIRKAAKKELVAFRKAKQQAIKDESSYKQAGMKVDSLNKQIETIKVTIQK